MNYIEQTVKCGGCGALNKIQCLPVINLQECGQEVLDGLFSLDLFKVQCKCGKVTMAAYDMAVVDLDRQYIVCLCSGKDEERFRKETLPKFQEAVAASREYSEAMSKIQKTRLVRSLNELREKLLIFDWRLDDFVVESLKLGLLKSPEIAKLNLRGLFFSKIHKDALLFDAVDAENRSGMVQVGIDQYNKVLDGLKDQKFDEMAFPRICLDQNVS